MPDSIQAGLQLGDIQGLVQRGYKELPEAKFGLFQITDAARARAWLGRISNEIAKATTREEEKELRIKRVSALHVAFTCEGLRALGLDEATLNRFPREFREGMVTPHRQALLGDGDPQRGDPAQRRKAEKDSGPWSWRWGAERYVEHDGESWRSDTRLHLLVLLYAKVDATLRNCPANHWPVPGADGLHELESLGTNLLPGRKEHFGFRDGIAQPHIAGMPPKEDANPHPDNTIAPGEILLGQPNAYSEMPEGPTDANGQGFGRNGTFLVFRQLHQDVAGFWKYIAAQTSGVVTAGVALASKMVGRWPNGEPLVQRPTAPTAGLEDDTDRFLFRPRDPHGFRCPIGSHIRRTNPRDSLGDNPEKALELANLHRMVRRGRAYGPPLVEKLDPALMMKKEDDREERGLHFICLNAAIDRQFEFVQNLWTNNPKFAGLYDDPDPLIGVPDGQTGSFTVQGDPVRCRYSDIPRFVQVRGGAYFFLPGIEAIRKLAGAYPSDKAKTL